jgi:hypothetical protein
MLLLIVPEQVWDWHCCSYCFCVFILFFISWSFVLCFVFPSLEFSVAGWRRVNLTLPFLNYENGDFSILMRDIFKVESGWVWPVCVCFGCCKDSSRSFDSVLRFYFNWDMTIVMQYWGCARHLKGNSWKGSCFVRSRIQWRAISSWLPARSRVCWSSHSCKGTLSSGLLF